MLRQLLVTLFACAIFSVTAFAQQTVVLVNSPANIAGSYNFTNAFNNGWGTDLTTGIWTEDVVQVQGVGPTAPNVGCDSLGNGAALAGKIAIVDRGACNFSLKALNAQKAGAIACVIVNNVAGPPVGMGAGTFGPDVMIPTVMISLEDGSEIKDEMAMGIVNMTIGTFSFPNDIGSKNGDILRNPNGVIPAAQAVGMNAEFQPGAIINNFGENNATNVILSTSIEFTPASGGPSSNVYNSAETLDLLEVDSAYLIGPDDLYVANEGAGTYTVTYNIEADGMDGFDADNTATTSFIQSENVYAKGGWDSANNQPARTNAYTISGGGSIEFFAGFRVPMGNGYKIDSVQFYVATNAANLGVVGAANITPYVYEWNDANDDQIVTNDEIEIVAIGLIESFPDPAATAAWLKIGMLDFETLEPGGYIIPDDNKTYFVGTRYTGAETVFFGFDENYDQDVYWNFIAPTAADLSYFIVNVWDDIKPDIENDLGFFTDLYGSTAIALYVNQLENSVGENNPEIGSFEVYPNPTANFVNVETNFAKNYDKVDYTIVSNDGSVVGVISRDVKGSVDNVSIEVSHLPAGQYYLNVNTVEGSISKAFTVQR